jgi:hypothetical protein
MLWKDEFRVVSSRGGDGEVLTGCASQNMLFGGSDVQVGGLRDRDGMRGRSTPVSVWVCLGEGEARTERRRATSECVPRKR